MIKKFSTALWIGIIALSLCAANLFAQKPLNSIYIGKKCPTCNCQLPETAVKLFYKKEGWKESFSGDFRGSTWTIDWEKMTVVFGDKKLPFVHYSDDKTQSITIEYFDGVDTIVIKNFYDNNANYRATLFLN
jgi:hypothetical protein